MVVISTIHYNLVLFATNCACVKSLLETYYVKTSPTTQTKHIEPMILISFPTAGTQAETRFWSCFEN